MRGTRIGGPQPAGLEPDLSVYLAGRQPRDPGWDWAWIRWRDSWLHADPDAALATLRGAYSRAAHERVEISCRGGVGRTGTALAALAVFDGLTLGEAITWVRGRYHRRAIEMPRQRRFVTAAAGAAT